MKGFAPIKIKKSQPLKSNQYQRYTAELKRRYPRDNSELLHGTATILVPRHLYDPTFQEPRKRRVWDCFAMSAAHHLLFLEESHEKGINQVFVFDNRLRLIERVETNPWKEMSSESGEAREIEQSELLLIDLAAKQCKIEIEWLPVPQVA